jgi:branched-chain amino acid transport system permease protein
MLAGQIVNGLVVGSMYALVALGFTLILGVLNKLNFAHLAIFVAGGFIGVACGRVGLSIWLVPFVAAVVGGLLGLIVEYVSFSRVRSIDAGTAASISSLALGLLFTDLMRHFWGSDPVVITVANELNQRSFRILDVNFVPIQGVIIGVTALLMAVLAYLISRTPLGRRIRAVGDHEQHAEYLGVNIHAISLTVFFMSSALAAVAGLLFGMREGTASTEIGLSVGLKALAVMAIGGFGDMRGAVVGGLLVGVIEGIGAQFGLGSATDLIVWVFMICVLLVRPEGLFGNAHHVRSERA